MGIQNLEQNGPTSTGELYNVYSRTSQQNTQTAPYQGDLWPAVVLSKPKLDLATFK